jgi:hypothetical protein
MARGPGIEIRPADPDRWSGKLPRPWHDQRSRERFIADLERETDASLRADPTRWPWHLSTDVPDRQRSTRGRRC